MKDLSLEDIRRIKAAQEEDVRTKVSEGRWDELQAEYEANLSVWRRLWSEGKWLPQGRPDPRMSIKPKEHD